MGVTLAVHWSCPLSLQSLTGHTSPVESVRLNTPEELIVAGSQSGSIRVWDLEAAKSRPPCLLFLHVWGPHFRLGAFLQIPPPGGLSALFSSTDQSGWHAIHTTPSVQQQWALPPPPPECSYEEVPK